MTAEEFNREFDLLYNNVMSDMAPGLDGYEKSVFLTMAQEEVVKQLYNGTLGDGFESSEQNRRYLANLIRQTVVKKANLPTPKQIMGYQWYELPVSGGMLVLIAEQAEVSGIGCCEDPDTMKVINVQPVKYDEVNKVLNNPFRRPNRNQALRADKNTTTVVIITRFDLVQYSYEFLKKPVPIIVEDLTGYTDSIGNTLSINGTQSVTDVGSSHQGSELDNSLHRIILQRAVQLAAASWASNNRS